MEIMVLQKRARPSHANAAAEFDRLLREHVPALYRAAYRWTGAVDRAEDLVQELLVRLYPEASTSCAAWIASGPGHCG